MKRLIEAAPRGAASECARVVVWGGAALVAVVLAIAAVIDHGAEIRQGIANAWAWLMFAITLGGDSFWFPLGVSLVATAGLAWLGCLCCKLPSEAEAPWSAWLLGLGLVLVSVLGLIGAGGPIASGQSSVYQFALYLFTGLALLVAVVGPLCERMPIRM